MPLTTDQKESVLRMIANHPEYKIGQIAQKLGLTKSYAVAFRNDLINGYDKELVEKVNATLTPRIEP